MKKTMNCLLVCCIIITASCSKQVDQLSATTSSESALSTTHFIGEHFGGGIIFYINSDASMA